MHLAATSLVLRLNPPVRTSAALAPPPPTKPKLAACPSVRPGNPVGADSLGRMLSKQHRQLVSDVAGLKTAIGAL